MCEHGEQHIPGYRLERYFEPDFNLVIILFGYMEGVSIVAIFRKFTIAIILLGFFALMGPPGTDADVVVERVILSDSAVGRRRDSGPMVARWYHEGKSAELPDGRNASVAVPRD